MNIKVKVVPNAKQNQIKNENDGLLKVYLTAPAVDGKANKALIEFLSKYLKIKKNKISIIKGLKSRNKTINIKEL